ncbi:MAG: ATPase [Candidatus Omnitrophota bacterium]|nr:MAG: ATPase [Candidatus Omnitrophota bacterium]
MNYKSNFFTRLLQKKVENTFLKGKIVIIYGARQVGKTSLCKEILRKYPQNSKYIDCELLQNKTALETTNAKKLKDFLGNNKLVVLDEAQKIKDIVSVLNLIAHTYPEIQIIATGSSSFELANKTSESLTGRVRRYLLYPLSVEELSQKFSPLDLDAKLESILCFGTYPCVFGGSIEESIEKLSAIASNYLYKDVFQFSGIRKPDLLAGLLNVIALQLGNEVSIAELADLLNQNSHTIESYLNLLEQCFIVFKIKSFSRNLKGEIGKKYKIYFNDLGIRNSLIQNFNPLEIRNDSSALWENFCFLERIKYNHNNRIFANYYFWRTYSRQEIDYIEERNTKLYAFEFKWGKGKKKVCKEFLDTYQNSEFKVINRDNYRDFVYTPT